MILYLQICRFHDFPEYFVSFVGATPIYFHIFLIFTCTRITRCKAKNKVIYIFFLHVYVRLYHVTRTCMGPTYVHDSISVCFSAIRVWLVKLCDVSEWMRVTLFYLIFPYFYVETHYTLLRLIKTHFFFFFYMTRRGCIVSYARLCV